MPWLFIATAYLIGSIPTAYLAGRLRGGDIRRLGDGNVGAANAYHVLGAKTGILVFLLDTAKGALAIFIAQRFAAPQAVVLASGAAAVAGHNWPVWLRFRGGRGESTTIGVLYSVVPLPVLICGIPALVTLLLGKNAIRASAVFFILLPFISWWLKEPAPLIIYGVGLPALVGVTHYFRVRPGAQVRNERLSAPPA